MVNNLEWFYECQLWIGVDSWAADYWIPF